MSHADPLRIGVAGLGRAFTLMLPTFLQDPRVRLVAAFDPRAEARTRFAREFSAPVYEDIDGLVRDDNVEVVYVASPHQFHAAQAQAIAAAGKHVLVEKPMALTLAECDAMIAACKAAGVHLVVGHSHSFDAPYREARRLIDLGELGEVRMIHALNYTDFLYRPRRPEELRTEDGGGVVFSQAAHQVDVVRLLAGAPVTRVRAVTGNWDRDRSTEGAYSALLWFAGGAFASLTYSGYGHFDSDEWCGGMGELGNTIDAAAYGAARRRLAAAGDARGEAALKAARGYGGAAYAAPATTVRATSHQHFGPIIVSCAHADVRPMPDGIWIYRDERPEHHPLPPPAVPRSEVIDEVERAVRHGDTPLHGGEWGRATLATCLALLESARKECDVVLNPGEA